MSTSERIIAAHASHAGTLPSSRQLYIAQSTAKSHIAHIYQKSGMNSQQKIMDEVERRMHAS